MNQINLYVTILAGGMGKRMQSKLPKVLHEVKDVPMIVRIIREVLKLNPHKILLVVGQFKDIIQATIKKYIETDCIEYVTQDIPMGTGHAVKCTLEHLDNDGINLIINGDIPLLTHYTMQDALEHFKTNEYNLQITGISTHDPTGCGRIIIKNGIFLKIVEEKDCDDVQKKINYINCGIYISHCNILKTYIPFIENNNSQKEYYLTDIVEIYKNKKKYDHVGVYHMDHDKELEIVNVNTKEQLDQVNEIMSKNNML